MTVAIRNNFFIDDEVYYSRMNDTAVIQGIEKDRETGKLVYRLRVGRYATDFFSSEDFLFFNKELFLESTKEQEDDKAKI